GRGVCRAPLRGSGRGCDECSSVERFVVGSKRRIWSAGALQTVPLDACCWTRTTLSLDVHGAPRRLMRGCEWPTRYSRFDFDSETSMSSERSFTTACIGSRASYHPDLLSLMPVR